MMRYGVRYLMAALMCLCVGSVTAYPQSGAALPELQTKRLLNSLQIVVAPTPQAEGRLAIGLVVRYGSAFDGEGKTGLAHLLSRMLQKAATDQTEQGIGKALADLGATLEIRSDWDGFQFLLEGNSATFERSLLLLYQVVCEAQFPEEALASVKQEVLHQLEQGPDSRTRLRDMFEIVLFGGTTYGRPIQGTPDTVRPMTPGDLKYFYNRHFSPDAAALVVTGDVDPAEVLAKAARIWGLWIRMDPIPFTFAPSREPSEDIHLIEDDPGSSAVEFIFGNLSPRRQDPVFSDVMVATHILRQRLRKLLPTSLLTVGLDGRRMPGAVYVQGQSAADEAIDQILAIQESMETMKTAPVLASELAAAQNGLIGEFNGRLGTTGGFCRILLDMEMYRLGSYYATAFPDRIRSCDADAVRQAARDYLFPGRKIVLLRGDVQTLLPELDRLGAFKRIAP